MAKRAGKGLEVGELEGRYPEGAGKELEGGEDPGVGEHVQRGGSVRSGFKQRRCKRRRSDLRFEAKRTPSPRNPQNRGELWITRLQRNTMAPMVGQGREKHSYEDDQPS
ncbi:hypothetical protein B296_00039771 [Ensete ventricosum]|uniref:Uncharacterized protein n=1 Tax=Ensete ventricosum TaxID=4639 RepID=A0A426XGU5_ENSVE|nr:hypothetical protein B296_00039771 [Ensete ventricosum]